MTKMPDLNLGKCAAAAALTPRARQFHLTVLETLAISGRAPRRAELERATRDRDAEPGAVLAELAERDVITFDTHGEIRAAYPFSCSPTSIQVAWDGGPAAYAMCAIDALGMSAMLGRPVTIIAAEPGTSQVITVDVDGGQARWRPRRTVVFAGTTPDAGAASADRTCGYINFFTTARAARQWARRHPRLTGNVLTQAEALRNGIAEFGTLMHRDGDGREDR
jgi:Alkylmercury lyase